MKLTRIFLSAIFIFLVPAGAQKSSRDFDQELQSQNKAIEVLKQEIQNTRQRIERENVKEKSTARKITDLEQELSLIDRLISEINREINKTVMEIADREAQVNNQEKELEQLKARYARRVVYAYKQGTLSPLEQVISSTSWRQAVYRTKYLAIISDLEKAESARIQSLIINISQQKLNLEAARRHHQSLIREQVEEKKNLRSKKSTREKELNKIRQNRAELASLIREKQAGIEELENVRKAILEDKDRFERAERLRRQQEALKARNFGELEGNLAWPAKGRIITKFGRQWNPKLKTTTESPGIDIKGQPGSPITTVMNGIVTTITYIRGYGTTIIIDHGSGFYTVYSHVTNIQTNLDSEVRAGDVIAYMGDSGSVNGSMLHFEIWGKNQKLNPETWLKNTN